ncbi:glycosyltransferase family 4 protein [Methyloversatilis discipulorum]|uniref:glycosyltransferase family 4 protein n=1 Tax=Methyloversatilis discipulorum TaxID=1119528 RepID=UPI003137A3DE
MAERSHAALTAPQRRLVFVVTEDWYFCLHWMNVALAAQRAGYRVTVLTRVVDDGDRIRSAGFELIPIDLRRRSSNPLRAVAGAVMLLRLYRKLRPDIVQHITVKPVIFGSLAARLAGVPAVVNTVAGLGYLFSSSDLAARCVRPLVTLVYRLALAPRRHFLVVQNHDDLAFFMRHAGAAKARARVIPGVGVDIVRFSPVPEPEGIPQVLMPARLLRDKGIFEFVAAARLLRQRGVSAIFSVAGDLDPENPASVSEQQLKAWKDEGIVNFLGWQSDMAPLLRAAHIVALPSYREGLPTALTEAAACGRPVVTCDVPGCREVVTHGENGLLVKPRDPEALADAIARLASDVALRHRMGLRGRERAERGFAIERVAATTLALYSELF